MNTHTHNFRIENICLWTIYIYLYKNNSTYFIVYLLWKYKIAFYFYFYIIYISLIKGQISIINKFSVMIYFNAAILILKGDFQVGE